ncbi:AAA family ATPase [Irpex rosettiformis]|uniref:AAA family ATPase n=1 Tax=Irpex rosettiformis TaxID=378272 RepID=A0ACB8UHA7_9APHY|nr:AAA family ATPase [Irpex rosettiformis]
MSISGRTFCASLHTPEAGSRGVRQIMVHVDVLKASKVSAGDALLMVKPGEGTNDYHNFAVGIAWPSVEGPLDTVAVSDSLALAVEVVEGTRIQLFPLNSSTLPFPLSQIKRPREARYVRVKEVKIAGSERTKPLADETKGKRKDWLPLLIREHLVDLKFLTGAQITEVVYEGHKRRFQVVAVSTTNVSSDDDQLTQNFHEMSLSSQISLWTVTWDTFVSIISEAKALEPEKQISSTRGIESAVDKDAYNAVGGLDKQIAEIRDLIEIPLTRPQLFRRFGLKPPRGILLHGPPGTGKTHLARAIAASTNSSVIIINGPELSSAYHGETESKIRDVFTEARLKSPCIVVLDEVDALCPKREEGPGGEVEKRVVAQLLTIMDGMSSGIEDDKDRVVIVATTNRPNAIDPALRRPGRFDREIEIGIPDAEARASILKVLLSKAPHTLTEEDIRAVASRAHGYVGADLSAVVREAGTSVIKRWASYEQSDTTVSPPQLSVQDLTTALTAVRPSTMRSVFLDTVPVRYSDIGGQAETIQKLRESVEWPLLHPDAFERLGVRAPKGVLLYGPPGCSKTLLVRACASESGVNFVAVKGPELLNKYLGESERAVREVFRKARAAAPSIIFFDEIDALATSRYGADSGGSSHDGVLTSLLNEMDGVEELVGVTVVAATNRPDAIDSALMRPGRLDRVLYIGPPNLQGRIEILRIRTRKMAIETGLDIDELARQTEGCSGAELSALCQEAALRTMKEDIHASHIPHRAFFEAAKGIRKQITPEVIAGFQRWRDANGVPEA